jgi:hypothetical protein
MDLTSYAASLQSRNRTKAEPEKDARHKDIKSGRVVGDVCEMVRQQTAGSLYDGDGSGDRYRHGRRMQWSSGSEFFRFP